MQPFGCRRIIRSQKSNFIRAKQKASPETERLSNIMQRNYNIDKLQNHSKHQ